MSPAECVPGGHVPNLLRFRRRGWKAFVLAPKADRRKDWEDEVIYYIGYTDKSCAVGFDESISERSADYFR